MHIVFGIISVVLLGIIINFAVSPKSSRLLRLAAIIALVLIGLSVGVCGILLIRGSTQDPEAMPLPFLAESESKPEQNKNMPMIISFSAVFLFLAGLVFMTSLRESKKPKKPVKKAEKPKPVQNVEESPVELNLDSDSGDDDNFNLEIK